MVLIDVSRAHLPVTLGALGFVSASGILDVFRVFGYSSDFND